MIIYTKLSNWKSKETDYMSVIVNFFLINKYKTFDF